jgi:hypothetical protein
MRAPALEDLRLAAAVWNSAHPVGTPVTVRLDNGRTHATKTRSRAAIIGDHSAVIWLEGMSGCYALERVTPAPCEARHGR